MSCEKWEEPIALLVDGEPPADGLAEHLERCATCSQLLQDLRADQIALRTVPELDVAPLQWTGRRGRIRTGWWATAAIAAGLAIVFAWPGNRPDPLPPQPKWDNPPGLSPPKPAVAAKIRKKPRRIAPKKQIDSPARDDWAQILFEPPELEKRLPRGSTSEVAMQIQTSNPDVVILLLKEERFE